MFYQKPIFYLLKKYHSANCLSPSLKLVDGLYPKSFSNALVSAYVIGTSPFCIGTSFMCPLILKSFGNTPALISSSAKMLTKSNRFSG